MLFEFGNYGFVDEEISFQEKGIIVSWQLFYLSMKIILFMLRSLVFVLRVGESY